MFRLKELRLENGLKRSELSQKLGIPASTLANYENETRQAPYDVLILLANFFEVSVDFLLNRTDDLNNVKNECKQNYSILSVSEKKLITDFRSCSNIGKNKIQEYVNLIKNFYE